MSKYGNDPVEDKSLSEKITTSLLNQKENFFSDEEMKNGNISNELKKFGNFLSLNCQNKELNSKEIFEKYKNYKKKK